MDWQLSTINPAIVPLFWALIRTPEDKRDQAAIQAAVGKSAALWKIVDDRLAKNKYLAGDEFTIGDIPLCVWAYRWFNLPIYRPKLEHVSGWYEPVCRRKPYQTHIMIPLT